MNKTFDNLKNLLGKDERFVSQDGKIMRNAVYEAANKMDEKLLSLLTTNEEIKNTFFKTVNGMLVFDKQEFNFVINNRELLPDSYTRFKQKIGLVDSKNDFIVSKNDVVLSFPFKDCVLEFDSTDPNKDRKEILFNETLAHDKIDNLLDKKIFTNAKLINENDEQEIETFDDKSNLLIKGNNLLVMHSLLPRYRNQIKLIYWDVLYNTESDKVPYADSFKHSSWLVMMKNRLEVAKQLLKDDGVICIQCDDNEMAYLKVLMDEIFGRENLINVLVVEMASTGGLKRSHKDQHFLKTKEYILIYYNKIFNKLESLYDEWLVYDSNYTIFFDEKDGIQKLKDKITELNPQYNNLKESGYLNYEDIYNYIIENKDKIYRRHNPSSWAKKNFDKGIVIWKDETKKTRNEVIKVYNDDNAEFEYLMKIGSGEYERLEPLSWNYYENKFKLLRGDIWKNYYKDMGNVNKQGGVKLSGGKKPERLLIDLIKAFTSNNEIVLDAYFGTGTTGSATINTNRIFIGIEQLDSHMELAKKRIYNVITANLADCEEPYNGGGSFIYCELKKLNQEYIDRIKTIDNKKELAGLALEVLHSDFISCNIDVDKVVGEFQNIENLEIDDLKKVIIELLDKNQLYVNYSDIDDEEMKISDKDKKFNKSFYGE